MPSVVPVLRRNKSRRLPSGATSSSSSTSDGSSLGSSPCSTPSAKTCKTNHTHGTGSTSSSTSSCSSQSGNGCFLCRRAIKSFKEQISCGHRFHADCYWNWLVVRTNVPKEKSLCPSCGFLEVPVRKSSVSSSSVKSSPRPAKASPMVPPMVPVRKMSKVSTFSRSSSSSGEEY